MRWWFLVAVACYQPGVAVDGGVSHGGDGGPDATSDQAICLGQPGMIGPLQFRRQICVNPPAILPPLMLSNYVMDTASDARCVGSDDFTISPVTSTGPGPCVVAAKSIQLVDGFSATGPSALVLFATDDITITALVDVSSHVGMMVTGPGAADISHCSLGSFSGGEGGPGGSFEGSGGSGGGIASGPAVASTPDADPFDFHAGCPGAAGGLGTGNTNSAALGGAGGGAVYLIAGGMIQITGAGVFASGAGGSGGIAKNNGGGGGGAGGAIVIEASQVEIDGTVRADGGGGGGASGSGAGSPGSDPSTAGVPMSGSGGSAGSGGGSGGSGSLGAVGLAGETGSTGGGGGGGGGAGLIRIHPMQTGSGEISPSPMIF